MIIRNKFSGGAAQSARRNKLQGRRVLAALALGGVLFTSHAGATNYQLELVVFLRSPELAQTIETYAPAAASLVPASFYRFSSDQLSEYEDVLPVQTLQNRPLNRLGGAYNRLKASNGYQILYTAAWTQSLTSSHSTIPLHIRSLEQAPGVYQFEGTLSLSRDRFVHARIDLGYAELEQVPVEVFGDDFAVTHYGIGSLVHAAEDAAEDTVRKLTSSDGMSQWQVTSSYRLNSQNRLQTGEVNYVDHPYLGVLLYAKPLE